MSDETTAPSNIIKVSLDTSVTPNVLTVVDNGNNSLPRKPAAQRIRWTLTENLANCQFVPLSECRPGFEWLSWPAPLPHIFGSATIGGNGSWVEITDLHENDASAGIWLYRLRVQCEGVVYETILSVDSLVEPEDCASFLRIMVGNNPVIINR